MLTEKEIAVINELDVDLTHSPELVSMAGTYIDKLRTIYPEVTDDDLGKIMLDQASCMSALLTTTTIVDVPGFLARMVSVWMESGVQLTRLTRELTSGNY